MVIKAHGSARKDKEARREDERRRREDALFERIAREGLVDAEAHSAQQRAQARHYAVQERQTLIANAQRIKRAQQKALKDLTPEQRLRLRMLASQLLGSGGGGK